MSSLRALVAQVSDQVLGETRIALQTTADDVTIRVQCQGHLLFETTGILGQENWHIVVMQSALLPTALQCFSPTNDYGGNHT
jgi:hypothetical protein